MTRTLITLMMVLGAMFAVAQDDAAPEHRGPHGHLAQMDTDGDGQISLAEFSAGTEEHFNRIDADGDGFITTEEMKAKRSKFRHHRRGGHMGKMIRVADADQSGDITADEWNSFLASVTVEGTEEIDMEALHEQVSAYAASLGHQTRERRGFRGGDHGHPGDVDGNGVFETTDLNQIFAKFDADEDGALSAEELPQRRSHRRGHGKRHR